jgi:hypothetical protein
MQVCVRMSAFAVENAVPRFVQARGRAAMQDASSIHVQHRARPPRPPSSARARLFGSAAPAGSVAIPFP